MNERRQLAGSRHLDAVAWKVLIQSSSRAHAIRQVVQKWCGEAGIHENMKAFQGSKIPVKSRSYGKFVHK